MEKTKRSMSAGAPTPRRKKHYRKQVAVVLQAMYPETFARDTPKPLAIGIHDDIAKVLPDVEPWQMWLFMIWWTNRYEYLISLSRPGSKRHNLEGEVVDDVKESHRWYAGHLIVKRGWDKPRT